MAKRLSRRQFFSCIIGILSTTLWRIFGPIGEASEAKQSQLFSDKFWIDQRPIPTPAATSREPIAGGFTITRLCRDKLDTSCVEVCPVDCIYQYTGSDRSTFPNQLYINHDECIDCGACVDACPWHAILEVYDTPSEPNMFSQDIRLNTYTKTFADKFKVATFEKHKSPSQAEIQSNYLKWGIRPDDLRRSD